MEGRDRGVVARRPAATSAGLGVLAGGLIALLPPSAMDIAVYGLVLLGMLGGASARTGSQVLALVAGTAVGTLLVGSATLGTALGPANPESLLLGLAITTGVVGGLAAGVYWLTAVLRRAGLGGALETPPPVPPSGHLPTGSRRAAWRAVGLTVAAALGLIAVAILVLALATGGS